MKDILIVYFDVKCRILEMMNEVDNYFILIYRWNIEVLELVLCNVKK